MPPTAWKLFLGVVLLLTPVFVALGIAMWALWKLSKPHVWFLLASLVCISVGVSLLLESR